MYDNQMNNMGVEVWSESPCLMIKKTEIDIIVEKIEKKINKKIHFNETPDKI